MNTNTRRYPGEAYIGPHTQIFLIDGCRITSSVYSPRCTVEYFAERAEELERQNRPLEPFTLPS
jgi:hypothetical protein